MIADFGLGGWSEDRFGQLVTFTEIFWQSNAANRSRFLVFGPARARKITADHAFDRYHLGFTYQHAPAGQLLQVAIGQFGCRWELELGDICFEQVVGNRQMLEPEIAHLGQNTPLVGDWRGKDPVVRTDPIGAD